MGLLDFLNRIIPRNENVRINRRDTEDSEPNSYRKKLVRVEFGNSLLSLHHFHSGLAILLEDGLWRADGIPGNDFSLFRGIVRGQFIKIKSFVIVERKTNEGLLREIIPISRVLWDFNDFDNK